MATQPLELEDFSAFFYAGVGSSTLVPRCIDFEPPFLNGAGTTNAVCEDDEHCVGMPTSLLPTPKVDRQLTRQPEFPDVVLCPGALDNQCNPSTSWFT